MYLYSVTEYARITLSISDLLDCLNTHNTGKGYMLGNLNNNFLQAIVIVAILYVAGTEAWDIYRTDDEHSKEVINDVSLALKKGFDSNANLLRYLGEQIIIHDDIEGKAVETLIRKTPSLSYPSLTTSYISIADKNGVMRISGKAGILPKNANNIQKRQYYETAKKDPWGYKFSVPEKSLFSVKYVLPSAMGFIKRNGDFVGYLVLGYTIGELYDYIKPSFVRRGYHFYVYDVHNDKYVPTFNTDDETFYKKREKDILKKIVPNYPFEIHIYKERSLILIDKLYDNLLLLLSLCMFLGYLIFMNSRLQQYQKSVMQLIENDDDNNEVNKLRDLHDLIHALKERYMTFDKKIAYLQKEFEKQIRGKRILEMSMYGRENHHAEVMNKVYSEIEEVEFCLSALKNICEDTRYTKLISRCSDLMDSIKDIKPSQQERSPYSLNSIVEETIFYYSADFHENEIMIEKKLDRKIPICAGDQLSVKHCLISILGKILEESYGLKKISIKSGYCRDQSGNFYVEVTEKSSKDGRLAQVDFDEYVEKLQSDTLSIEVKEEGRRRDWYVSIKSFQVTQNDQKNIQVESFGEVSSSKH